MRRRYNAVRFCATDFPVRGNGSEVETSEVRGSMENNQGFAWAYGWNAHYQKVLGYCAIKNEGILARNRAWFWAFLISITLWIPQAATLIIIWGDMTACIICLSTNMTMIISIAKIIVLQAQRNVISSIVRSVSDDWIKNMTNEERRIMLETAKISRFISILSFTITNVMVSDFIFLRLWKLWEGPNQPGVNPELSFGFVHDSYFPFDTSKNEIFMPIWIGQFFATIVCSLAYAGPDCFVSMVVLHVCGQLRIIRHSLKYLVDETTVCNSSEYWKKLTAIIKRHEQLNDLAYAIRKTFSSILLVQMVVCSITFCFQGYTMFTTILDRDGIPLPLFDVIFTLMYTVYTVVHLFVYCYVGDKLLVESTSIADDFYETEWYDLPPEEAKAFLIVCHRSRIALEVKAGKFCTFNLQLFNSIMKKSMGFLSMLMAMKERLVD